MVHSVSHYLLQAYGVCGDKLVRDGKALKVWQWFVLHCSGWTEETHG